MKSCKPQTQIERARDAAQKKRESELSPREREAVANWIENHSEDELACIIADSLRAAALRTDEPFDIEAMVCYDIKLRQRKGINKYGTTVANNPLPQREWLIHLYHELLDAAIYAKRQLVEPKIKEQNEKQNKGKNLSRRRNDGNGIGSMDAGQDSF